MVCSERERERERAGIVAVGVKSRRRQRVVCGGMKRRERGVVMWKRDGTGRASTETSFNVRMLESYQ